MQASDKYETVFKTASGEAIRMEMSRNPAGWTAVSFPDGARLTKDMIDFDLDRPDIQVNIHGVVLFQDQDLAESLLGLNDVMAEHLGLKRFDRPKAEQSNHPRPKH